MVLLCCRVLIDTAANSVGVIARARGYAATNPLIPMNGISSDIPQCLLFMGNLHCAAVATELISNMAVAAVAQPLCQFRPRRNGSIAIGVAPQCCASRARCCCSNLSPLAPQLCLKPIACGCVRSASALNAMCPLPP